MTDPLAYLREHRDQHLDELKKLISIPSVSSDPRHEDDMHKAAQLLADSLQQAGLENVQVMETAKHPLVYADWLHAPGRPTALIYGHYDVQPPDPVDQWLSPPFEPTIRDNKLYGRGATDDKAQMYMHIKAVQAFLQTAGTLPINIKFCLEGEEEIASPSLPAFMNEHKEKLACDLIVISDGPMYAYDQPSICCGLRGLCAFEIEVTGASSDLHSGLYGGGVANPATALTQLLASMKDADGRVLIEGFYDQVQPLSEAEQRSLAALHFDAQETAARLGVPALFGEKGYSFLEHTSTRPTLEINGIYGGYEGEDIKTIIPSCATAKISCRLVDQQDPEEILELVRQHIAKNHPRGVRLDLRPLHGGKPYVIDPEHPFMRAAEKAYEAGFRQAPVFIRSGGSIPIVETFARQLNAPVIMLEFGLPDENLHAPNEHFRLENFDRGLQTLCTFWAELGK